MPIPVSIAYVPRGPIYFPGGDSDLGADSPGTGATGMQPADGGSSGTSATGGTTGGTISAEGGTGATSGTTR